MFSQTQNNRDSANIGGFSESDSWVSLWLPGLYPHINHHDSRYANVVPDSLTHTSQDRYRDPMAGATTNYDGFTLIAQTRIQQGQELFLKATNQENKTHVGKDEDRAQSILSQLYTYHTKFPHLSQVQWIDILYRLKHELLSQDDTSLKDLLPSTLEELVIKASSGLNGITRGFDWVQKHGTCFLCVVMVMVIALALAFSSIVCVSVCECLSHFWNSQS